MRFKDILNIDAHFQNSINIGLDLNDVNKINSYIPTTMGINFLNYFIDNIISKTGEHSSMLIAPYGKGKSHAVLVLLSLLSSDNYDNYRKLLNKIKDIDFELYNKIINFKSKKFLPLIISNTRGTLNQALMRSLERALLTNGIKNITLNTDFQQIKNRIYEWKNDYLETYSLFLTKLKERKVTLNDFYNGINEFDENYLSLFKSIHREISSGAEFVSQNTLEVIDYYQEITNKLISEYGFEGVYIVFDEFSKFLESREESTISNDMKIIQDLAELCNASDNMYLQLILHKPISDYLSINKRIRNAFKGIEGRVSSYYFTTSLKNSYDLISSVLIKNDKYYQQKHSLLVKHKEVVNDLLDLPTFNLEFEKDYLMNEMVDDCYPLHPITVYLLIRINEKVAQNERTLFTFLAKKTTNSLISLIERDTPIGYLMPDVIYDYFETLLIEEKDNVNIQKITSQAISAIKNITDPEQIKLIKILALILIINEKDSMPSNTSVLSKSTLISHEHCKDLVNELIEQGLLVRRHGGQIQFKINMDLNINNYINDLIVKRYSKISIDKELSNIMDNKYYYPRTYNIANSITRYFQTEYILERDFLSLKDVNYYFSDSYTDGLILNIVREDENHSEKILEKVAKINNDRLVVIYPKSVSDYFSVLKKMLSIKYLLNDSNFIDNNILIKTELELMYDDTYDLIKEFLNLDYSLSSENNYIYNTFNERELTETKRLISKDRILGNILSNVFYKYPNNLNLELINKNVVKGTYKNAREKVIEKILNNSIDSSSLGTSPVDTIINCILLETGILQNNADDKIYEILHEIDAFFENETGRFEDIYKLLRKPPFGLRKGVIPLFLAYVISKKKQCILIRYKGQEIELSASCIESINDEPENYSFTIDEINSAKMQYIDQLSTLFNCSISDDMAKNYSIILQAIKEWYIGLPKFTKQMIGKNAILSDRKFKILRKQLSQTNLNSSEFILFSLPKIVGTNELDLTIDYIGSIKNTLDDFVNNYLIVLKKEINDCFGFEKETMLVQSVNFWLDKNQSNLDSKVLEEYIKDFITISKKSINDTEFSFINKLAYCLTNLFVEDWSDKTHDIFMSQLNKIKEFENVQSDLLNSTNQLVLHLNGKTITKNFDDELDDSVELVETFIESTMEDYGDLLTNEQKIALLIKIMKKYI